VKNSKGHGDNPEQFVEVGQRFGRLIVIDPEVRKIFPSVPAGRRAADCRCDCGAFVRVPLSTLVRGRGRSCGCYAGRRRTHGLTRHPLYSIHNSMMQRCYSQTHAYFHCYGGRGITVCPEWHDPAAFIAWIEANLGPRPEGMTLDRIDNETGNYEPGNVRWATWSEQRRNQRGKRDAA